MQHQFEPCRQLQSPRCYKQQLCCVVLLSLVSACSGLTTCSTMSSLSRRYCPLFLSTDNKNNFDASETDKQKKNSLFPNENEAPRSESIQKSHYGDVMPLKRPASSEFGDVVPMNRPTASTSSFGDSTPLTPSIAAAVSYGQTQPDDLQLPSNPETVETQKKRNVGIGTLSILLAISNYLWQFAHPITPVQLLFSMEQNSVPITLIGTNNRPTVVDFWAPW